MLMKGETSFKLVNSNVWSFRRDEYNQYIFKPTTSFSPLFPLVGAECSSSLAIICIAELVIQYNARFMLINYHTADSHCIVPTKSTVFMLIQW